MHNDIKTRIIVYVLVTIGVPVLIYTAYKASKWIINNRTLIPDWFPLLIIALIWFIFWARVIFKDN